MVTGLLIGLLVGMLLFGPAGFVVGRTFTGRAAPVQTPSAELSPSPSPSQPPYERAQEATNKRELSPALQGLAAPWLPYIGSCSSDGKAVKGEKTRVTCEHGDVSIGFVEFDSMAAREKARLANLARHVDARRLTPGVAERREGPTPSGRTTGTYIEYAYTAKVGRKSYTVAAIWWDDKDAPIAAYVLAYWNDDLGKSWEPLRDLWSRHA